MNKTQYLLLKLNEEATEIAKEAAKCMQFGFESGWKGTTNRERLNAELDDLMAVLVMLRKNGDFDYRPNQEAISAKQGKVAQFAQMSADMGFINAGGSVFEGE